MALCHWLLFALASATTAAAPTPAVASAPGVAPVSRERKFAYVMLLGSTSLEHRDAYMGYVSNALLAARALRRAGSRADFVVMIGYLYAADPRPREPPPLPEEGLLESHGVTVMYLPGREKAKATFKHIMLLKYKVYLLAQYDAVQFLDADILPHRNMDYAFTALDATPHTDAIGAGTLEPMQGGWFLAKPARATYDAILEPYRRMGHLIPNPHDPKFLATGWGRAIPSWHTQSRNGSGWTFHGAAADQGLSYYYARFASNGTCAVFFRDRMEYWLANGTDRRQAPLPVKPGFIFRGGDYIHMTGRGKPWLQAKEKQRRGRWGRLFRELVNATSAKYRPLLNLSFPLSRPKYRTNQTLYIWH